MIVRWTCPNERSGTSRASAGRRKSVLACCAETMSGQQIGNSDCFPGQGLVQYWTLVKESPPYYQQPWITGVVTGVGLNTEGWNGICADYDWSVFIRPDPDFAWTLTNSAGVTNNDKFLAILRAFMPEAITPELLAIVRVIECEVHNIAPIRDALWLPGRFAVGSRVEAIGWWVEDHGHDAKTEIHPTIVLIGGDRRTGDRFNIYAAQDTSGRFDVANAAIQQELPIPFPPADAVDLLRPGSDSLVNTLDEYALCDAVNKVEIFGLTDAQYLELWAQIGSRVVARPSGFYNGSLILDFYLSGASPFVAPVYHGDFARGQQALLEQTVVASQTQVNGRKVLVFDVTMHLADPDVGALAYRQWRFDDALAAGGHTSRTSQGQEVQFQLRYGPAAGWTQTQLRAGVIGSTRALDWSPGRRSNVNQTSPFGESRFFVQAARAFTIQPSRLKLKVDALTGPLPLHGAAKVLVPTTPTCTVGYRVEAQTELLPGAALMELGWTFRISQLSDGTPADRRVEVDTTVDHVMEDSGFGFDYSFATAEPTKISIGFHSMNPFAPVVGGTIFQTSGNAVRVHVDCRLLTDLGEVATATSSQLHALPCASDMSIGEMLEYIERVTIAIEQLIARGIPINPWPEPVLKNIWPPPDVTKGNPLRPRRRVPEVERLQRITTKWIDGGRLDRQELTQLATALGRGRRLSPLGSRVQAISPSPSERDFRDGAKQPL